MAARPYQTFAVEKVLEYAVDHPTGSMLVVLPMRAGKTWIGAEVVNLMGVRNSFRSLWLAHRRELVLQAKRQIIRAGISPADIGLIMSGDKLGWDLARLVQVASEETLHRNDLPEGIELVVADEAHRDRAPGRKNLRQLFPKAFWLGLTGTPVRGDGESVMDGYDHMLVVSSPSELIREGYLDAPRVFTVPIELLPSLHEVPLKDGDYEESALGHRMNRPKLVGEIVAHWKRRAEGRRTLVYPVNITHSKSIVARFVAEGIPAAHLDGTIGARVRDRLLDDFRRGELLVLASCGVLSEGVDLPEAKCVVLARPTQSLPLYLQQATRGMTPWNNVVPLVLDHAGNAVNLGLPQRDHSWSKMQAEKGTRRRVATTPKAKACPHCHAVARLGDAQCPSCQKPFRVSPTVTELDGELVEVMPSYSPPEKDAAWARILVFARRKGQGEAWARHIYEAMTGEIRA